MPKENMHYNYIACITIDSIKMSRFINAELKSDSDLDSDSEPDSEAESKSDAELMAKLKSDSDSE